MTDYTDRFWSSRDGLRLHYRDYAGPEDRPPVLCLHGLSRNARDFEGLADRIAGEWRVLVPEMRGRGDSDYAKATASYSIPQYVEDLTLLFEDAGIDRFVAVGTSMGGLMTMVLATIGRERIAGALLNDIGPVLERDGLDSILEYVGQGRSFPTWMHAARALCETHEAAYPDYETADWLAMAKRLMVLTSSTGRIVFDYDMAIAEPFAKIDPDAPAADLWPGIDALNGRPMALLRGELSELLSPATFEKMGRRLPDADAVTVPRVGHAPTLDEPEAVGALDRLLARVAAAG
jgi:pimeloyl-ACP methyl ester carboxylesterase